MMEIMSLQKRHLEWMYPCAIILVRMKTPNHKCKHETRMFLLHAKEQGASFFQNNVNVINDKKNKALEIFQIKET